ncbi:hypothetical protein MELA_01047 [Candidatus Methylomirabilis lanthanidiphila]|uniref:Uncharacterized protein n=1 Tax=Candidatus Methylomirabilis lanthanidiphila TaxID=2211376 RepID=A0A564ZHN5_9BACT|nr:hypothetical protein MELA_01047 [Candidatus Methylomirabilis lanthanidiphila]
MRNARLVATVSAPAQYWPTIPALVGPGYPTSLVAVAEERGVMCIETLVEQTVPRLQYTERLLPR